MLSDTLQDVVLGHLGTLKQSPKKWLVRNCPLCVHRGHGPDHKGRFGIKLDGDGHMAISCFNCAFKAKYMPHTLLSRDFVWFLETIGIPKEDVKKLKFQAFREKEAGSIFDAPKLKGNLFNKWVEVDLPDDALPMMTWLEQGCEDANLLRAASYAIERNVNPSGLFWTPLSECQYKKRFILPFYFRKKIVGYTARYTKETTSKVIPRYLNNMPDSFVYNLDAQEDYNRKYCLLHEGVLDAYVTDGISCMGSINQDQIDIIHGLKKEIIVCPDRDKAGGHLIEIAMKEGWAVSFPHWRNDVKDAGKASQVYGRLLTLKSLIDSAERNPLKIHVSRKMDKFK